MYGVAGLNRTIIFPPLVYAGAITVRIFGLEHHESERTIGWREEPVFFTGTNSLLAQ